MIRRRLALGCYSIPALVFFTLGAVYLSRTEFMPYHQRAAGVAWSEIPPGIRVLLLSMLRAIGASLLTLGIALLVVIWIPLRRGRAWAGWTVPFLELLCSLLLVLAAHRVHVAGGDLREWTASWLLPAAAVAGALLLPPGSPRSRAASP